MEAISTACHSEDVTNALLPEQSRSELTFPRPCAIVGERIRTMGTDEQGEGRADGSSVLFYEFPVRLGSTEADAFSEGFELIDDAERLGLDAFWLSESHCQPGVSVLAAPMTIASAIAGRTKRMKIGLAVQVLPLGQPAADRRGRRNGGPDQPRSADLRGWAQRKRAGVQSVRHPVRGEP